MEKKVKQSKPKSFEKKLGLFLSSLTCRQSKYLYINVSSNPNTIVLTNGDYEILTSFVPDDLSITTIILNNTFYNELIDFLSIPNDKNVYIFRTEVLSKALKKSKKDNIEFIYDKSGDITLYQDNIIVSVEIAIEKDIDDNEDEEEEDVEEEDVEEVFTKASSCGRLAINETAIVTLDTLVSDTLTLLSKDYLDSNNINYVFSTIPTNIERSYSNIVKIRLDDKLKIFDSKYIQTLNLIDGLDMPSMKEYCKKENVDTLEILLYKEESIVNKIIFLNTEDYKIITCRPYNFLTLLTDRNNTNESK